SNSQNSAAGPERVSDWLRLRHSSGRAAAGLLRIPVGLLDAANVDSRCALLGLGARIGQDGIAATLRADRSAGGLLDSDGKFPAHAALSRQQAADGAVRRIFGVGALDQLREVRSFDPGVLEVLRECHCAREFATRQITSQRIHRSANTTVGEFAISTP